MQKFHSHREINWASLADLKPEAKIQFYGMKVDFSNEKFGEISISQIKRTNLIYNDEIILELFELYIDNVSCLFKYFAFSFFL